jgi:hypothetical protein
MNNLYKRYLLFLIGCIGLRTGLVVVAKNINKQYLPYASIPALLIGFGFLYIYFTGSRKTGGEVFGEKIWWNDIRPVHATLYLTFAYLAFVKSNVAYVPLLIDVIIGLTAFLNHHFFKLV